MNEDIDIDGQFIPVVTIQFGTWIGFILFSVAIPVSLYLLYKVTSTSDEYGLFRLSKEKTPVKKLTTAILNSIILVVFGGVWAGFTLGLMKSICVFKGDLTRSGLYLVPLFILVIVYGNAKRWEKLKQTDDEKRISK